MTLMPGAEWPERRPSEVRYGGVDEPLIDPDCLAGKHTSCVGGPCECPHHRVHVTLAELGKLSDRYGPTTAAVMMITGLTAAELEAVGGVGPSPQPDYGSWVTGYEDGEPGYVLVHITRPDGTKHTVQVPKDIGP